MKKKQAFTIIETLIAISILAVSITILSTLQVRSFFKVLKSREAINRVFFIKKELYENFFELPRIKQSIFHEIEDLNLKITTAIESIENKSTLHDFVDEMQILNSVGRWSSDFGSSEFKMLGLVLRPKEKK